MDDRYFAGLFDGEGYVRIARWEKPNSWHIRYQIFCGLGMTYLPVIQLLQEAFGGALNQNRHDLRNKKHRIQYTWNVASQKAATFLRRVYPYLIVKKEEAEIALAFQDHVDNTPYKSRGRSGYCRENSKQIYKLRDEMCQRITALKKRSFPPLTKSGPRVSG